MKKTLVFFLFAVSSIMNMELKAEDTQHQQKVDQKGSNKKRFFPVFNQYLGHINKNTYCKNFGYWSLESENELKDSIKKHNPKDCTFSVIGAFIGAIGTFYMALNPSKWLNSLPSLGKKTIEFLPIGIGAFIGNHFDNKKRNESNKNIYENYKKEFGVYAIEEEEEEEVFFHKMLDSLQRINSGESVKQYNKITQSFLTFHNNKDFKYKTVEALAFFNISQQQRL